MIVLVAFSWCAAGIEGMSPAGCCAEGIVRSVVIMLPVVVRDFDDQLEHDVLERPVVVLLLDTLPSVFSYNCSSVSWVFSFSCIYRAWRELTKRSSAGLGNCFAARPQDL